VPSIPRPDPCFLDQMESVGAPHGQPRWQSPDRKRLYEWDHTHGEIEVYNRWGYHLGALDAVTGELIKGPRKGRRIDV
jgi:hypothetical protein